MRELPRVRHLDLKGVRAVLLHGDGNFFDYWVDKWYYLHQGYRFERYARLVRKSAGDTQVMIFGHTHHPECLWEGDVLMFNPGSASMGSGRRGYPSIGVLKIYPDGSVEGAIHFLGKFKWNGHTWSYHR
jgi:predicted phosphodiesterase